MSFDGYTTEALGFLEELPGRDPDWFKANSKDYQRLLVAPTKALVAELGDRLGEQRPEIVAQPKANGSIAPINNDLRFSPDKSPYKDHLLLRFWEGAVPKKHASTLFVRLSPDGVGLAVGIVPTDVDGWRETIDSDAGAELAAAVEALATAKEAEVAGQALKKVPAPYPSDHPRADLLRHKMLQVRWMRPLPASIDQPGFVDWCVGELNAAMPMHALLVGAFR